MSPGHLSLVHTYEPHPFPIPICLSLAKASLAQLSHARSYAKLNYEIRKTITEDKLKPQESKNVNKRVGGYFRDV